MTVAATRTPPRRRHPHRRGPTAAAASHMPPAARSARRRPQTMRSACRTLLLSAAVACHWGPSCASAEEASTPDDKMRAMAKRLVDKMEGSDDAPPSWTMARKVLEHSFLDVPHDEEGFYQSSSREEKGRQQALHWLAHEDHHEITSTSEYEAGLLQRYALAAVYFATDGDDSWTRCARKQHPSVASLCESEEERYLSPHTHLRWDGINGKNGLVNWLDLSNRGMVSTTFLPLELTLLSPSLELLWVSENAHLEGSLPKYLGEFQKLQSLSAYKTSMSGSIPEALYDLPKLNSMRLYKSKFSGTISSKIENMGKGLKWLWIHDNEFMGTLPDELGKLSNLEGITLHGNKFKAIEKAAEVNGEADKKSESEDEPKVKSKAEEESGDEDQKSGSEDEPELKSEAEEGSGDEDKKSGSDVEASLKSNIIPASLCALRKESLKHLWTDCEAGAVTPAVGEEGGTKEGFVVKEGARACSCCTRCFPRGEGTVAAVE